MCSFAVKGKGEGEGVDGLNIGFNSRKFLHPFEFCIYLVQLTHNYLSRVILMEAHKTTNTKFVDASMNPLPLEFMDAFTINLSAVCLLSFTSGHISSLCSS